MAAAKRQFTTIDQYIDALPEAAQPLATLLRQTIREVAPEATEMIKYGMPTFVLHGNLVYFAVWKKHIGFYPITAAMENTLSELAEYKTSGRGTVQFPLNRPLPLGLVRAIVEMRVQENRANASGHKA